MTQIRLPKILVSVCIVLTLSVLALGTFASYATFSDLEQRMRNENITWYPEPGGDGPVQAKRYIQFLVTTVLPCLFDYNIDVVNYDTPGYYLRSSVKPSTVLYPPSRRTYEMFVNPQLFNETFGPNALALEAIITHELNHILDYTHMNLTELSEFGIKYALNYSFLIWYEHETDHRVLELDFGQGLKEYREWIYTVLTPSERHTKRIEYYTPLEIQVWMNENVGVYVNPCVEYSWNYTCNVCRYPD